MKLDELFSAFSSFFGTNKTKCPACNGGTMTMVAPEVEPSDEIDQGKDIIEFHQCNKCYTWFKIRNDREISISSQEEWRKHSCDDAENPHKAGVESRKDAPALRKGKIELKSNVILFSTLWVLAILASLWSCLPLLSSAFRPSGYIDKNLLPSAATPMLVVLFLITITHYMAYRKGLSKKYKRTFFFQYCVLIAPWLLYLPMWLEGRMQ